MTSLRSAAALAGAALMLTGCASDDFPRFAALASFVAPAAPASSSASAAMPFSAVVIGESGLAAGIPAAVQAFPDPDEQAARDALMVDEALPTLFPRQLPARDARGERFGDRVSIAPDGRRLLVGATQDDGFVVQVVTTNRKDIEREIRRQGRFAFVGWADSRTALIGYERGGKMRIERVDVTSGRSSVVEEGSGRSGVLTLTGDGQAVTVRPGRTRFACADGVALPAAYRGTPIVQAGPLDPQGRVVFRTVGDDRGVLVPYDCTGGEFGEPLYRGTAFEGALYDTAGRRYIGVWDADGPRYLDKSLGYEMREVAAAFPGDTQVWPIEFTTSPNTVLLYVSGTQTPPSYYVLDRYAGNLDLHVDYVRSE